MVFNRRLLMVVAAFLAGNVMTLLSYGQDLNPNIPSVDVHGKKLPKKDQQIQQIGPDPTNALIVNFDSPFGIPPPAGAWTLGLGQKNNTSLETGCSTPTPKTNPAESHPVVIATGEKFKVESDFIAKNFAGLSVQRTYRSKLNDGRFFGPKWLLGIEAPSLAATTSNGGYPESVVIWDSTGASATAYKIPGTYFPSGIIDYIGPDSVGHFRVIINQRFEIVKDEITYVYDLGGRFTKLVSSSGADLMTYNYDYNGRVGSISNSAGQKIQFNWLDDTHVSSIIDPNNRTWAYAYDTHGMLSKVTAPTTTGVPADFREYLYEDTTDATLLTGIVINGVRYSKYSYNPNKTVKESGLTGGEEVETYVYGGNYTDVTDARGQTVRYTFQSFDGGLKLTSTSRSGTSTCPAAAATIAYTAAGDIDYSLDFEGNKTKYEILSGPQSVKSVTTAADTPNAITTINTWNGRRLEATEFRYASGTPFKRIVYTYRTDLTKFDYGLIESETTIDLATNEQRKIGYERTYWPDGVLGQLKVTQYLSTGNLVEVSNYDPEGSLTSSVNALGQTVSFYGYDELGNSTNTFDLNGIKHDFAYNPNGTLKSIASYDWYVPQIQNYTARWTNFTYNGDHQITDIVYPDGSASRYRYTASGRLQQIGDAANNFSTVAYDIGTLTTTTSSARNTPGWDGSATSAVPSGSDFVGRSKDDSLGRTYTKTGNNGQVWNYRYDKNGNIFSISDANGNSKTFEYDSQQRLSKTTVLPEGSVTQYHYDAAGNRDWTRDARSVQTNYTYNAFGDVLTVASPDTGTTTYTYDGAGRMATETRANGTIINYSWDGLNRPLSRTVGTTTEFFTYDQGTYGKGHLTGISDTSGQTSYTYTPAGSLTGQTTTISGQAFTTTWTYDWRGF